MGPSPLPCRPPGPPHSPPREAGPPLGSDIFKTFTSTSGRRSGRPSWRWNARRVLADPQRRGRVLPPHGPNRPLSRTVPARWLQAACPECPAGAGTADRAGGRDSPLYALDAEELREKVGLPLPANGRHPPWRKILMRRPRMSWVVVVAAAQAGCRRRRRPSRPDAPSRARPLTASAGRWRSGTSAARPCDSLPPTSNPRTGSSASVREDLLRPPERAACRPRLRAPSDVLDQND